jgi:hypothetical protein
MWLLYQVTSYHNHLRGRRGHDHMVVGFTTTYAISAYHHWCCEFESRSGQSVQHYVIKFVRDLWQVSGFLRVLWFPPPIKLTATITEILLKVALNTIKQINKIISSYFISQSSHTNIRSTVREVTQNLITQK